MSLNSRVCTYLEEANFTSVCFFCSRKRPCQSHTSSDCDHKAFDLKRMKHDCNVSVIFWLDIIPSKKSPRLIFLSSFCLQKKRLIQLYGKNQLSNNKLRIAEEFALGKSLTQLASEMGILKQLRRCTPSIALQLAGRLTMSN